MVNSPRTVLSETGKQDLGLAPGNDGNEIVVSRTADAVSLWHMRVEKDRFLSGSYGSVYHADL